MNAKGDTNRINELLNLYGYSLTGFYETAEQIPETASGVYCLWSNEALEYIGKSVNIKRRLSNAHPVYGYQDICLIGMIDLPDSAITTTIEIALIKLLGPKQNVTWQSGSNGTSSRIRKVTQRNIGMYDPDWVEVDTLAQEMRISSAAAMRIIVDFWRENRDPSDTDIRLKALAERNMRGLVADDEYINETRLLILTEK